MAERAARRNLLVQMLVIGAVAAVTGVVLALLIDWFPVDASRQAHKIDTLYDVLLIVSVPVFVLVQTIVLFSVWKFRMRPGEELKDGPPIHGNTRLEIIWTAIPAILMVGLSAYAYGVLRDIEKDQPNAMRIDVVGQQFAWTFGYPQPGGGKPAFSNQLYLPKDRPIYFNISSKDVLHSFWVPGFRMKMDAVPGITTHVRVTPDRLGNHPVVCAELCGLGHATMRQTVHVVTPAAFERWLTAQRRQAAGTSGGGAAGGGGGGAAQAGKRLFTSTETGCGSCHTLADAGTTAAVGPKLDKVLEGRDEAFIRTSIVKPNAFVEKGYPPDVMPGNFGDTLSKQQIDALVQYLAEVTK
jgi:cytochrome c oxidase subunit II